jgi:CHAT domain-containing protein/predicted negative regulator of RcsB-dependent stress response
MKLFPKIVALVLCYLAAGILGCGAPHSKPYAVALNKEANQAETLAASGNYRKGVEAYETALENYKKEKNDAGILYSLGQMGIMQKRAGDYDTALKTFAEAKTVGKKVNGDAAEIDAHIGDVYMFLGDFNKARTQYNQALQTHSSFVFPTSYAGPPSKEELSELIRKSNAIVRSRVNLGALGLFEGKLGIAERELKKAEQLTKDILYVGNHPIYGMIYTPDTDVFEGTGFAKTFLGVVYKEKGQTQRAKEYLRDGMAAFEKGNSAFGKSVNSALSFQFDWLSDSQKAEQKVAAGDYPAAVVEYKKLIGSYKGKGDFRRQLMAVERAGWLLREMGQYSDALELLGKGAELGRQKNGDAAEIDANIGDVYLFAGDRARALEYFEKSLDPHQRFSMPTSKAVEVPKEGQMYNWMRIAKAIIHAQVNRGTVYYFDKKPNKALQALDEAKQMVDAVLETAGHPIRGVFYRADSDLYEGLGFYRAIRGAVFGELKQFNESSKEFDLALEMFVQAGRPYGALIAQALRIQTETLQPNKKFSPSDITRYKGFLVEAEMFGALDLVWRVGFRAGSLLAKNKNYAQAKTFLVKAVDAIEKTRSNIREDTIKQMFSGSVQEVYEATVGLLFDMGKFSQGFDYLERGKARAFLDMLAGRSLKPKVAANPQIIQQIASLDGKIEKAARSLKALKGPQRRGAYIQFKSLLKEKSRALERIKDQSLSYASSLSVATASARKIQSSLPVDAALISYFLEDSRAIIWTVDRNSIQATLAKNNGRKIAQWAGDYREALASGQTELAKSLGSKLYASLIEPIRGRLNSKQKLIVVPSGALHYLPFAGLRGSDGKYLIENQTVAALPNASSLFYVEGAIATDKGKILAFGDPQRDRESRLEFANKEVQVASKSFPKKITLTGENAKESVLKNLSKIDAEVLHFAVHGRFDKRDPLKSALLLTKDSNEDGDLETYEIYGLNINSNLVVLSACESGIGKLARGDEVQSLNRAFIYAGAGGVIGSLWKVSDESTFKLMTYFYEELPKRGPAGALRFAQIKLMKEFPSPYHWAAFYLTGRLDS